jgi:hypothetical protein
MKTKPSLLLVGALIALAPPVAFAGDGVPSMAKNFGATIGEVHVLPPGGTYEVIPAQVPAPGGKADVCYWAIFVQMASDPDVAPELRLDQYVRLRMFANGTVEIYTVTNRKKEAMAIVVLGHTAPFLAGCHYTQPGGGAERIEAPFPNGKGLDPQSALTSR